MALTAAEFVARFPEFGTVDAAVISRWIDEAGRSHNSAQWGGKSDDGLAYLTAHLIVTFGPDACGEGAAGPVSSEREGQIAVGYAVGQIFKNSEMGSTKYGRRYIQLRKTIFVTHCL